MSLPFEAFKALLDQVTTEQLERARFVVAQLVEVDPNSVQEGVGLARQLQGVSRSVSDIVLARGAVETTDLRLSSSFDASLMPAIAAGNILRSFANPDTKLGRMFTAQPSTGYGASMGVHEVAERNQTTTYDVLIPTDQLLDKLLMEEPCFWEDMGAHSRDFRDGRHQIAYPFSNRFHTEAAASVYFGVVQELSRELLEVTSGE